MTTKTKNIYLSDLHFEHKLWNSQLAFYEEEIQIFEHRLEELVVKYTSQEVLSQLEHLQNQFIRHKEVIDQLKHDIKIKGQSLSQYAENHPVAIDHVYFTDHTGLRDRMESFYDIYGDLKKEFMNFLRKWM